MSAFPVSIVSNTDPTAGNTLNSPDHAQLHQSHNAEDVAIETKLGTGSSTPTANTLLKGTGTGTSAWGTLTSAVLAATVTDETGSGALVFGTAPTISAPVVSAGTFASPVLTTPAIVTSINDANGNRVIRTSATVAAVNEITVTNAATGNSPDISVTGNDSNIGLTLTPKGTSGVSITKRFDGWVTGLPTPNTVTALGNRSYSCVFNSTDLTGYLSAGMRLRTTRTVIAPTQCTSLNGTTQYYSKSSPAGMTFTDDFAVSAWVKLSNYAVGTIVSRFNGTSGWSLDLTAGGQITLAGFNAGVGNASYSLSYQSVPLNKWVHIAAQLDMSTFTASTTTTYIMIDGVDVPMSVARIGTNPTALIQAGNLEIGSRNAGTQFFPGKIAQVAIYSAKVTQATILASMHQGLAGTETSLISAYSFNNSINDLNANANNLTANGSALATNADSPFGGQADGTISSTLDYGIITKTTFSTNTTLTVQLPEGCTIPTSGGVSAISYSTTDTPFGFPKQKDKWRLQTYFLTDNSTTSNATYGSYASGGYALVAPIGAWEIGHHGGYTNSTTTSIYFALSSTALTGLSSSAGALLTPLIVRSLSSAAVAYLNSAKVSTPVTLSAAATYVMYTVGATTGGNIAGSVEPFEIFAEFNFL